MIGVENRRRALILALQDQGWSPSNIALATLAVHPFDDGHKPNRTFRKEHKNEVRFFLRDGAMTLDRLASRYKNPTR